MIPVDLGSKGCQAVEIERGLDDDDKYGQHLPSCCHWCPPPIASVHKDGAGKMYRVSIIPTLKQISPSISLLSGCLIFDESLSALLNVYHREKSDTGLEEEKMCRLDLLMLNVKSFLTYEIESSKKKIP